MLETKTKKVLLLSGSIGVLTLVAAIFFIFQSAPTPAIATSDPAQVSFTATDGYELVGDFYMPHGSANKKTPMVIVANHLGNNPARLNALEENLLRHGYAVLTYDLRGTGRSQNGWAQFGDGSKSIAGAISYLRNNKNIDQHRIFFIGASVAGDFAAASSGKVSGLRASISLSPVDPKLWGVANELTKIHPKNIFIAANKSESAPAEQIFTDAEDYKQLKIYNNYGHGGALLLHPDVEKDILAFLQRYN